MVIPIIAFLEGGMRIPMCIITRDYLRAHKLAPTQYALNILRILGSVDALNEKMDLNLTHHDVNWVYNLYHLKEHGFYLKTKCTEVRLISCLLDSNKGVNEDFLIISREWHNDLSCLTREGKPSGVLGLGLLLESSLFFP